MSLSFDKLPDNTQNWQKFLESLANLFDDFEQERYLLERSMELSSREMRELFDKFESAQSIASFGSWYYDRTDERILWSSETYNIFGLDPANPVPHFNDVMKYVDEQDRALLNILIDRAFSEKKDYEIEFRIHHQPDNQIRWVYVKGHPENIFENDNIIRSVLSGVIMDITIRKEAQADLNRLNQKLVDMSRLSGMSEIATSVLHNIGNVLNSVNVSVSIIHDVIKASDTPKLIKLSELIKNDIKHESDYLTNHPKGKLIPEYIENLSKNLYIDHKRIGGEIENLNVNIQHIKDIVLMQKDISGISGLSEIVSLSDIIETAITLGCGLADRININILQKYDHSRDININKSKLLQILVNLIRNAKDALHADNGNMNKEIIIETKKSSDNKFIEIIVKDNGLGILPANMNKIFSMGFTNKINGHGFGLHSSALAAQEIGGSLGVESEGAGKGATFILRVPEAKEI